MQAGPFVHAVVFDLDGLVLDSERLYLEAFGRTQVSLGFRIRRDDYYGLVGLNSVDLRSRLAWQLQSDVAATAFLEKWNLEIAALSEQPIAVKAGVRELCVFLSEAGIPCAVATSSDTKKASDRLERADMRTFFSILVGGDQVQNGKPAPDTYLEAAKQLGKKPARTVAFEDSDIGVQAARAAGMVTVQVPDLVQPSEKTRNSGHLIVSDILAGARALGLFK